jgi:hypothetical protein
MSIGHENENGYCLAITLVLACAAEMLQKCYENAVVKSLLQRCYHCCCIATIAGRKQD